MGFNLKSLLPAAAGALTGGVMSAFPTTAPYAAAGSAAAGALTNSKNRVGGALQGFAGGGLGSAIGGGLASKNGFGSGAWQGLLSYGNSIPGFGGVGTSNPTGVFSKWLTPGAMSGTGSMTAPNIVSGTSSTTAKPYGNSLMPNYGMGSMINTGTTAATGAPATSVASDGIQNKNLIQKMFSGNNTGNGMNIPGMIAGGGVSMLGSMFSPKVAAPNFSSVTDPLRAMITNPNSDTAAAAQYYKNQMNAGPVDSTPGLAIDKLAHDKQVQENLRSFDQQWKAAMGGQDMTNNSEYQTQRQKILSDAEANWTANQSAYQFQYDQAQQANRNAAAAAIANMDQAQIQSLANLAQLDVNAIMLQTGMDYGDAQATKQLAATVGEIMMTSAAGGYKPATVKAGV